MKTPKGNICCNCKFWKPFNFKRNGMLFSHGHCTRFPPFAMVLNFQSGAIDHIQPITVGSRTCGEFKKISRRTK